MIAPDVGDIFEYRGATWQVRDFDSVNVVIKCLDNATSQTLPIAVVLADDTYVGPRDSGPSVADQRLLDLLSPRRRREAEFWYTHMYEVKYGVTPDEHGIVDIAPPTTTLQSRLDAKRHELSAKGFRVSERTIWRRWRGFTERGVIGCADLRGLPGHVRLSRIHQMVERAMLEVKNEFVDKSTPSAQQLIEMTYYLLDEHQIPRPSRSFMYELLHKLDRGEHSTGDATARRSHASSPDRPYGTIVALMPGEEVQLDTTPLDAMVLMPDGEICPVELAGATDVATGCLAATILRPNACKTVDALELLTKSLLPPKLLPGWSDTMAMARDYLPDLLAAEEAFDAALALKPLIDIRHVVFDRGRIFVNDTFIPALEMLAITHRVTPPGKPTAKPHIERALKTIGDAFVRYIKGYRGRSVNHRGRKPEESAVWPLPVLQAILDDWVVLVHQHTRRAGPRLALAPRIDLSPNALYHALSSTTPTPPRTLSRDEWIALQPCRFRCINRYGINLDRLKYTSDSPRFHELKRTKSPNRKQNGKWEVRYDPNNLLQVWVRDETIAYDEHGRQVFVDNGWIECRWQLADFTTVPFGIDVLQAILPHLPKRKAIDKLVLDRSEAIHRRLLEGPPTLPATDTLSRTEKVAGRTNLARQELCAGPPDEVGQHPNAVTPTADMAAAATPPPTVEPIRALRFTEGW